MSATISNTEASDTVLVRELRRRVVELTQQVADMERQNKELRDVVAALLDHSPPRAATSMLLEPKR